MENIEKNLYAFYRCFGDVENVDYQASRNYSFVNAGNDNWPQIIFDIDKNITPEILIPQLATDILNNNMPSIFVAPGRYISKEQVNILREQEIMPVKILIGMNLAVKVHKDFSLPDKTIFQELISDELIVQYSELINDELLSDKLKLTPLTLKNLNKHKLKLLGLVNNGQLLSALLLCISEDYGGLYFIVTKNEHQNKGFANALIKSTINFSIDIGLNELILQANQNSVGLYKKIGFVQKNSFIICKKI